jgi:hypothetical protein
VHPLTAYGCLVSVASFGAHITSRVLLPHLPALAANFRQSDDDLAQTNLQLLKQVATQMEVFLDSKQAEQETAAALRQTMALLFS